MNQPWNLGSVKKNISYLGNKEIHLPCQCQWGSIPSHNQMLEKVKQPWSQNVMILVVRGLGRNFYKFFRLKFEEYVQRSYCTCKLPCYKSPFLVPSRELTFPPDKACLKMIFFFPRWDMLVSWRVSSVKFQGWFLVGSWFQTWMCLCPVFCPIVSFWYETWILGTPLNINVECKNQPN